MSTQTMRREVRGKHLTPCESLEDAENVTLQRALNSHCAPYRVYLDGFWWPLQADTFPKGPHDRSPITVWHVPIEGGPTMGFNDAELRRRIADGTVRPVATSGDDDCEELRKEHEELRQALKIMVRWAEMMASNIPFPRGYQRVEDALERAERRRNG